VAVELRVRRQSFAAAKGVESDLSITNRTLAIDVSRDENKF
jgi:hypothetical protein